MLLPWQTEISNASAGCKVPAFKHIAAPLEQVRELINEQFTTRRGYSAALNSSQANIEKMFEYMRNHNGKMIRPGLLLLAGACFGDITDQHIRVAAMVEMIHDATLLHDDVIDNGQTRRSKPTVNSLWGNESAVLLGDFLLSRVFRLGAELEHDVARIIASAAVRVCEGELRQIEQKQNWQLEESEYIDIISEKSAVLFSICCELGALLARADKSQVRSLADFGLNAGVAFQITDDLLDILGNEDQTGKTAGNDFNDSKLTLPIIHLLKTADDDRKQQVMSLVSDAKSSGDVKTVVEILKSTGCIDYARSKAAEYADLAVQALSNIKPGDARSALIEIAEFMTSRTM